MRLLLIFLLIVGMGNGVLAQPLSTADSLWRKFAKANDSEKVSLLVQLHQQYANNNPAKGLEYLQKALAIAQETDDKDGIVNVLGVMANFYNLRGDYQQAVDCYLKAVPIRQAQGQKIKVAGCFNNVGEIYRKQGNYPQALEYHLKSLQIKEEIGNKVGISNSLNNIGLIYFSQKDYLHALDYYLKALQLRESSDDKAGIAKSLNNIGEVYLAQNKEELALDYYLKSLTLSEQLDDQEGIALSYSSIGEIHERKGNFKDALENYDKSLRISQKTGDKRGTAIGYHYIARVSLAVNDHEKAVDFAMQSLKIAREIGLKEEIRDAYENLHKLYAKMNDPVRAYEFLRRYVEMKDSLVNEKSTKKLIDLQAAYAVEQKQSQIKLLTQQQEIQQLALERQHTLRNALIAGIGVILLMASMFYRTSEQRRRANHLLMVQKEEIQVQANEIITQRDALELHRNVIQKKNKDIESSIRYARRIQTAMLPQQSRIAKAFPENFIFFKPRDMVSGDFYWFAHHQTDTGDKAVIAAVDCTGHGVPGAFMSMIGDSMLSNIVNDLHITQPDLILNEMHKKIRKALHQDEGENRDGMDISICTVDFKARKLEYAGANNPIIIISEDRLMEVKADKFPIGGLQKEEERIFTRHEFSIDKPMTIYLFSDGYQDQFGGENDRKFSSRNFKSLLADIYHLDMEAQKEMLYQTIEKWRGTKNQIDDMLVMGFKIG